MLGALDATNHLWSPPVGGSIASVAAAPLTYNATSLIIPGALSYTTSSVDIADVLYLGNENWQIISITKADGSAVTNPAIPLGSVLYGDYSDPPAKTVYGAGQALARASYPAYFAAVTPTQAGTLTAGNNTIVSVGNTAGLGSGMPIDGTGIQSGTVISSVTGSSVTMSKTATANGSQSISVVIPGTAAGETAPRWALRTAEVAFLPVVTICLAVPRLDSPQATSARAGP